MVIARLIFLSFLFILSLSGCESTKKAFGNKKLAPDEFLVYARPPLSQPPDFGLRPPKNKEITSKSPTINQAKIAILEQSSIKSDSLSPQINQSLGTKIFL